MAPREQSTSPEHAAYLEEARRKWSVLLSQRTAEISEMLPFDIEAITHHTANGYSNWLRTGADALFFAYHSPIVLGALKARVPALESTSRGIVKTQMHELVNAHVIGGIIPRPDETAAMIYERSQQVLRSVVTSAGWRDLLSQVDYTDFNPQVMVLDDRQQSILSKELSLYLRPYLPEAGPATLERTVQLLQMQIDKLHLNNQVELHVCQPKSGEIEILLQLARATGDRKLSRFSGFPVDVYGLGKSGKRTVVRNTIGFKIFPDDLPYAERLSIMGGQKDLLRAASDVTRARATSVNDTLLGIWDVMLASGEDIFTPTHEESPFTISMAEVYQPDQEVSSSPEYGDHKNSISQISVVMNEMKEMTIGAVPGTRILLEYADGAEEEIYLDFGGIFDDDAEEINGILKPSLNEGLVPFKKHLPMLPGIYRLQLLLATADRLGRNFLGSESFQQDESLHQFTILELYSRLSEKDFVTLCKNLDPDLSKSDIAKIMQEIEALLEDNPRHQQVKPILLLISHFHLDHIGLAGMMSARVPHAFLGESDAIARYLFERGSSWMNEVVYRRYREQQLLVPAAEQSKTKKIQRNYSPPLHSMEPYETRFVGRGNVMITALPCDHSMYGATMFLVMVLDDLGNPMQKILYTGDFRFKDAKLTEEAMEFLKAIGGVDTCISETTNLGNDSKKASQEVTKEKQQQAYYDIMKHAKGPVIVQSDPKDMGLMWELYQAARDAGRHVIASEAHASLMMSFEDYDKNKGYKDGNIDKQLETKRIYGIEDSPVLEEEINMLEYRPRVRLGNHGGQHVGFHPHGKSQLNGLERELYFYHEDKVVPLDALDKGTLNGEPVVILVPPYVTLESIFELLAPFLENAEAIRAYFFPYQLPAKKMLSKDQSFCRKHRWKYHSDYYMHLENGRWQVKPSADPKLRRSGHGTKEELTEFLGQLFTANPDMVLIPVHGMHRYNTGHAIEEAMADLGISFTPSKVQVVKKVTKGEWVLPLLDAA